MSSEGARLDPAAGRLLNGWLLFALGAAGVAGLLAVVVAMTRTPFVRILPTAELFYVFLAGHIAFSLIIWLLAFVVLTMIYAGAAAGAPPGLRLGRWGLALAVLGSAVLLVALIVGGGEVILHDYVPVLDTPLFLAGYVVFGLGIVLSVGNFLRSVGRLRGGPLPLPVAGMTSAAACVCVAVAALLVGIATVGTGSWQAMVWGAGHAIQYVYVATTAVAWYILAAAAFGVAPASQRAARVAFALYPLLALPVPFLYLMVDPIALPKMTMANFVLGAGLSLPTLVHILVIAGAILRAGRQKAPGWFRQAWRKPETSALVLSLVLFFIGGLLEPSGSRGTLRVSAHYHAMLVGGVTLAVMGLAYHVLTATSRGIRSPGLARLQPYLFGVGVLLTVGALTWAGALGAPRKTYEVGLAGTPWSAPMNLMGLGAFLATLGGAAFVVNVLASMFQPVPRATPDQGYQRRSEVAGP